MPARLAAYAVLEHLHFAAASYEMLDGTFKGVKFVIKVLKEGRHLLFFFIKKGQKDAIFV
jgi:hypothetical protein